MAKVLMLDVDGVLVRHPDERGWSVQLNVISACRLPSYRRRSSAHWQEISNGRAALRERLAPVLDRIAPHVGVDRFIRYWFEQDAHLDQALLDEVAGVRARGLQVHLATVQEHERAAYLWNDLGLREHCEAMHYAADLGFSKPEAEFYRAIEDRTGFSPDDILFVDDREANVLAARERGWTAEVWTPGAKLRELFVPLA